MGFINNTSYILNAVLTKKGKQYLSKSDGKFNITKFALADDEIDYSLWDMTVSGSNFEKPFGQVIDNQPITEPNVNWRGPSDGEIMKSLLYKNTIEVGE